MYDWEVAFVLALVPAIIARLKGHSPVVWWIVSALFLCFVGRFLKTFTPLAVAMLIAVVPTILFALNLKAKQAAADEGQVAGD